MRLSDQGVEFGLIVLGQGFRRCPSIFARARQALAPQILHWGYVADRDQYAALLRQADLVVSTARHEFFGYAVMEAVRAGCRPLVPDRLSYRELYPEKFRYRDFLPALAASLKKQPPADREEMARLAAPYGWDRLAPLYEEELAALAPMRADP